MEIQQRTKGFTLIELLVTISIIAVLAAVLFPVFARARENARRASCLSNLKQMGLAFQMYSQDFDEHMPPSVLENPDGVQEFTYPSGAPSSKATWYLVTQPYIKSWQMFNCPSAEPELRYVGNYSYARFPYSYNYVAPVPANPPGTCTRYWNCGVSMGLSTDGSHGSARRAAIEDPSGTIAVVDGSAGATHFYKGAAQMANETTVNAKGACSGAWQYTRCVRARHLGTITTLFVDGHVKAMQWQTILGSDTDPNVVKFWTTAANPLR